MGVYDYGLTPIWGFCPRTTFLSKKAFCSSGPIAWSDLSGPILTKHN